MRPPTIRLPNAEVAESEPAQPLLIMTLNPNNVARAATSPTKAPRPAKTVSANSACRYLAGSMPDTTSATRTETPTQQALPLGSLCEYLDTDDGTLTVDPIVR